METIIICLLVLAVTLLLYVIARGKKDKNNVPQNDDPLAGLPDIIGRPKGAISHSLPSTATQRKRENAVDATDNIEIRNEGATQVSEIPHEGPDEANALPDLEEEEEEMGRYATYGTVEGFATGVTFDELATVGKMLECQALERSEEITAAEIVSKIDGTELLGLLESKIGDASKRIALLLDRGIAKQPNESSSILRKDNNFDLREYL
jgi:hypothetical protein